MCFVWNARFSHRKMIESFQQDFNLIPIKLSRTMFYKNEYLRIALTSTSVNWTTQSIWKQDNITYHDFCFCFHCCWCLCLCSPAIFSLFLLYIFLLQIFLFWRASELRKRNVELKWNNGKILKIKFYSMIFLIQFFFHENWSWKFNEMRDSRSYKLDSVVLNMHWEFYAPNVYTNRNCTITRSITLFFLAY